MIKVSFAGGFQPHQFRAWSREGQKDINKRVRRAMFEVKPAIDKAAANDIKSGLNVRRANFTRAFQTSVQYQDDARPPIMATVSKIPWLNAHIHGMNIGPKQAKGLMIPINVKALKSGGSRIGYRAWQKIVAQLASQGNLHFVKRKGKVLVLAETAGSGNALRRHNKRIGADRYGKKRSLEVPIAVLVPQVTIKKRLNIEALASGPLGRLLRAAVDKHMRA